MWFEIIPSYAIITASLAIPGYGLYWIHHFYLGNFSKSMWYEILPSFFIITAGLGLPGWGLYHIHNLVLGNHYRRTLLDRWHRHTYQRDCRLTGNAYKVNGLEAIPDK